MLRMTNLSRGHGLYISTSFLDYWMINKNSTHKLIIQMLNSFSIFKSKKGSACVSERSQRIPGYGRNLVGEDDLAEFCGGTPPEGAVISLRTRRRHPSYLFLFLSGLLNILTAWLEVYCPNLSGGPRI